jgi:hypothetical protein
MATARSTFVHDYVPGLFAVAVDSYDMFNRTKVWDQICHVKSSKKQYEEKAYRSTLDFLQEKPEGENITYDSIIGGPKKRWVPKVYALGTRITEEAISDNLYEDFKDTFKDLGTSAAEQPEILLAQMFNNATSTTYHTVMDGATAIADTTHDRLDGSTYSNKATSSDLTYLTFWTNVILLQNQYDHRQKRVRMNLAGLMHPPQLTRKAVEVLQSTDRPDTGNRSVSAIAKKFGRVKDIEWPYMTDTDMWVLQGDNHDLIYFKRWNTRFVKEGDFENGDIRCKTVMRCSVEMGDPRGFYFVIP